MALVVGDDPVALPHHPLEAAYVARPLFARVNADFARCSAEPNSLRPVILHLRKLKIPSSLEFWISPVKPQPTAQRGPSLLTCFSKGFCECRRDRRQFYGALFGVGLDIRAG